MDEEYLICEYSGLPSLAFYLQEQEKLESEDKEKDEDEVINELEKD
jgi:hypothetical protein